MDNKCKNLPGIRKLFWLRCASLPPLLMQRSRAGIPARVLSGRNEITFSGSPSLETSTEYVNNAEVESVSMEFGSLDELPRDEAIAFFIIDANGDGWLVGTREMPYPTVKRSKSIGAPSGTTTAISYTVELTARKALLEAIV